MRSRRSRIEYDIHAGQDRMESLAVVVTVEVEHQTVLVGVAIRPPDAVVPGSRGRPARRLYLDDVRAEFGQYPPAQLTDVAGEIDDGDPGEGQRL